VAEVRLSHEPVSFKPEAILFDLFGTLIPTGSQADRTLNLRTMAHVLSVDADRFAARWLATFDDRARGRFGTLHETIGHLAREVGGDPDRAAIRVAAETRMEWTRTLFDRGRPSLDPLDSLREGGLRLGLVTDTSDDTVRVWPSTELASRFDVVLFSCVEGVRKPDGRLYRAALERLRVGPAGCAFVGDGGSHELSGAEAAGIRAFQYCFPEEAADAYRIDLDPAWHGPRLTDLRQLLPAAGSRRDPGRPSPAP
jgi:putative hydrolase of the HAD superfamily